MIVDGNENGQGTTVGPYMEGDNLRLYCDVRGGEYRKSECARCNNGEILFTLEKTKLHEFFYPAMRVL